MHQKQKNLQLQYIGFHKTPFLWYGKGVFNLEQFNIETTNPCSLNTVITENLRLGKLVERFVSFDLKNESNIDIIVENVQIQKEKITLGEIDCLLFQNNVPIHLEIIYKFYLYDPKISDDEIYKWIGPNKRDSLVQKLTKLKNKQLPLLFSEESKAYLKEVNLISDQIKQQIYFKAQLYIPLNDKEKSYPVINNNCIAGFYCHYNVLKQFAHCKLYIPSKHDWLIIPHANVEWLSFENSLPEILKFIDQESSPLCWVKKPNGEFIKLFVVWW
ncbi:hypothetical protein SAMN04489761_0460 [Tenacibaculum sp. MAR_2009_124]|uniref:DUF1853 family protein n=1 Tax=Tenacibaculum sp. MAR_2009_124 TaxID=1250059 RepID=UPI00089ACAC0|nr:DUF1853 family protein [Tenacibaculum sp. MAR_2009_124]SEB39982.1 hypothetical protein SAMN04489761_0460 [Tenacibaculum sp. MAR_2009_124]